MKIMDSRTELLITAPQAESGIYVWQINNPLYFKLEEHHEKTYSKHYDIITIQIQFNYNLRKALQIHKCWFSFKFFITLSPRGYNFLNLFRSHVLYFLNDLGVILVNNVIRIVSYFVSRLQQHVLDVSQDFYLFNTTFINRLIFNITFIILYSILPLDIFLCVITMYLR